MYCFWILKLAPFVDAKSPDNPINIKFALFLLLRMVRNCRHRCGKPPVTSSHYIKNLAYSFKYRDLSKEAIMSIAESLLD